METITATAVAATQQQQLQATPLVPGPIYIDTQHEDLVHDAQMDYYGVKLATCSSDRTVKVYNVFEQGYELVATLQGHEGPVWQVSWAHPKFGVLLASCSFDGSVLIHAQQQSSSSSSSQSSTAVVGAQQQPQASKTSTRAGAVTTTTATTTISKNTESWTLLHAARRLHESSVNGVAFAPHEFGVLMLATAGSDGKVSVMRHEPNHTWTVDYITECCPMGVNAVSWAPYGASYDPQRPQEEEVMRLVTAGCDNAIRFWMYEAGQWQPDPAAVDDSLLRHSDWVRDVAWAPTLLPEQNMVASASEDGTVLIWKQSGLGNAWKPTLLHHFDHPVWRVSWSMTGYLLAVSSGDSDVTLWKQGLDGKWTQVTTVEEGHAPTTATGSTTATTTMG